MTNDLNAIKQILDECRSVFAGEHSYFAGALAQLTCFLDIDADGIYTDGSKTGVFPEYLLSFVAENGNFSLPILHVILHCLLLHPFHADGKDEDYDLASDIAVGYITDDMKLYPSADKRLSERKRAYSSIKAEFKDFNEKNVSLWIEKRNAEEKEKLKTAFKVCNHSVWRKKDEEGKNVPAFSDNGEKENAVEKKWREIATGALKNARYISEDLKRFLRAKVIKSKVSTFFKKFLFSAERTKTDPDEFDMIYYYLGLERYKNVPLIENLEYREDKNFQDVVLAVDTSGSTQGEPITRFINEIYTFVKNNATERENYGLRIIQCDCEIQSDVTVRDSEEFDTFMKNFEIKGGGGTDFRPVFDLIAKDARAGRKTRAIIYFTDGFGIFPEKDVGIRTCFAIYGGTKDKIKLPYFAYGVEIEEDNYEYRRG